jgi:hypothetical protein
VTKSIRAPGLVTLLLLSPGLLALPGCTDLTETPTSSITPQNFYRNEQEVLGGLAAVYAQLRTGFPGEAGTYYVVSEISTDEMVVPTRGQDWYDNGRWLEIHRQLWTANSPAGLSDLDGAWVQPYIGIARANVLLGALPTAAVPQAEKAVVEAEARTLRAFYYYQLMDFFGGVPIVTTSDIAKRPRSTRQALFTFIQTELDAARQVLPAQRPSGENGRLTKGAADAILASMYLNAAVFTKDAPNATAYNSCLSVTIGQGNACQAASDAADRILNSGVYQLATDWRSNFTANNHSSPENILVVNFTHADGLGFRMVNASLHYNQFNPSPWNGFSTLAETYAAFDQNDQRRQIFLVGPQVNLDPASTTFGQPVTDRQKNPLVFTPTIRDVTAATEGEGVRYLKFPPDPSHFGPDNGNYFPYFRLGEIYLIKAEALNEMGRTAEAVALVNTLRARVFNPAKPLTVGTQAAVRDAILNERLFELTAEGKRRQDLIRYGRFTAPFGFKEQREPYRVLMPIPQTEIDANPQLKQNPGY